jgi:hypothetical protein
MTSGVYELHFHNDLFTTADYLIISLGGASNMAPLLIEMQLTDIDLNTASAPQTGDSFARIGVEGVSLGDLGGMSDGMKDEVGAESVLALTNMKLDHLVSIAENSDVADNSIIAKMVSASATATFSSYDNTEDSLEALRDNQGGAAPTAVQNREEMDNNSTQLAAIVEDTGTTLPDRLTGIEGATFDTATDSLEVIRNDRTLPAADYVVVGDTIARVTLVDTTTTNTDKNTLAATDIVTGGAIDTTTGAVDIVTTTVNLTTNNDKTDYVLSAAGVTAILNEIVDTNGNITLAGFCRLLLAVNTGESTGGGTGTLSFKALDEATIVLTALVDGVGNRDEITVRDQAQT